MFDERWSFVTKARLFRPVLGAIAFFCVAPGAVAGLVPWLISGWRQDGRVSPLAETLGAVLVLAGLASLVESFARFVIRGRGTPAPVAPPTNLVVTGQYRHVRNPMYVALVIIVAGQGVWLGSGALLAYATLLWVLFHLRVVSYEEPTLAKQFGASYEEYQRGVPRWLPRSTPWRSGPRCCSRVFGGRWGRPGSGDPPLEGSMWWASPTLSGTRHAPESRAAGLRCRGRDDAARLEVSRERAAPGLRVALRARDPRPQP